MSNNAIVTLISRILMSILFIPAGFGKLTAYLNLDHGTGRPRGDGSRSFRI